MLSLIASPLMGSTAQPVSRSWSKDDVLSVVIESIRDASISQSHADPRRHSFAWISLDEATGAEIDELADLVGLDDHLLEDALSPQQRARVEIRPNEVFMVLKTLEWIADTSDVVTGQVAVFIGPGFAITRQTGQGLNAASVLERLRENPDLHATGPISVAWAIADLAVDGYLTVGDSIAAEIETIEEDLFSEIASDLATTIYRLNRENIEMRRAVRPLLSIGQRLAGGSQEGIPGAIGSHFRDIGDHILRANDMVDAYDTALITMLMASTARQDLRQNRDMRKIAAWAAIIAVPTAIAGIYGMNFDDMPELHWSFGYPLILAIMATICFVLYRAFKRSGWV